MPRIRIAALLLLTASPLFAQTLDVRVEIPRLDVAEYHAPYLAMWIETPAREHVANLTVRYDIDMRDNEGTEWLKDMRQWWRRSGRGLDMPVDGISGATLPPGTHALQFDGAALTALADGEYRLLVEAAREVGGREVLEIPFAWPVDDAWSASVTGEHELGTVTLGIQP